MHALEVVSMSSVYCFCVLLNSEVVRVSIIHSEIVRDGWGVCQVEKGIIIKISKTSILLREISRYKSMVD